MIVEQVFTVEAPLETTAAFFVDVQRVAACVPGVEDVEEVEPGRYRAVLAVRLGPIRASFEGSMALDDSEAPARLKAAGEGRDRATGSVAKVQFTADLTEQEPGRTTVTAVADVALRGRMAQFGTGVMRAAAGDLVEEFAACANASLARHVPPADRASAVVGERPPVPHQAPASRGLVTILLRSVVRAAVQRLRAVVVRVRESRATAGGQR